MPPSEALPLSPFPSSSSLPSRNRPPTTATTSPTNPTTRSLLVSTLAPLALALSLTSPLPSVAISSPASQPSQPSLLSPTTPFTQSQNLQTGLDNGKVRPCPSTNPGCISTNPKSSSFAFPWVIPEDSYENSAQKIRDAILKTQRNVKFQVFEETPDGQYLQAEVDGRFGRDVMEFLVKKDYVFYRCIATKVTYVYPFTTAIGDSSGQKERIYKIAEELGWYAPDFESID